MRLLAVEQLRKIEKDALEVKFASVSLCLHWCTCFFVLFHFRVAFTMGEEVGVTFPGSWGA